MRMTRLVLLAWVAIGGTGRVFAQASAVPEPPPTLSELERTQVELLQVRIAYAQLRAQLDACKAEVGSAYNDIGRLRAQAASQQLTADEARLRASVEAAHPGYTWDPKTQAFTKKPVDPPPVKK